MQYKLRRKRIRRVRDDVEARMKVGAVFKEVNSSLTISVIEKVLHLNAVASLDECLGDMPCAATRFEDLRREGFAFEKLPHCGWVCRIEVVLLAFYFGVIGRT